MASSTPAESSRSQQQSSSSSNLSVLNSGSFIWWKLSQDAQFCIWWENSTWFESNSSKIPTKQIYVNWGNTSLNTSTRKASSSWSDFLEGAMTVNGNPSLLCLTCKSVITHPALLNYGTSGMLQHKRSKKCSKNAIPSSDSQVNPIEQHVSITTITKLSRYIITLSTTNYYYSLYLVQIESLLSNKIYLTS